uniref:Uncharacterized protein n=1 Tax=Nelumbo nucifera TaxID=4432 RepID=A0A823A0K5_NELNU|nr:TPA_asm: hypothetical protein HUJ06_018513 [Nelumbo nucifera]
MVSMKVKDIFIISFFTMHLMQDLMFVFICHLPLLYLLFSVLFPVPSMFLRCSFYFFNFPFCCRYFFIAFTLSVISMFSVNNM